MDHVAHGWSAEEIHRQHPDISVAQAHAALAFYYDHQAEFDHAIAESAPPLRKDSRREASTPLAGVSCARWVSCIESQTLH